MKHYGISFNGIHSYEDLNLTLESKTIGNPKKIKALVQIPFSNIEYDMSELYGDQTYENRDLEYSFNVYNAADVNKEQMNMIKINALNAYMGVNKRIALYDDAIPGYHFIAEIRDEPSFTENRGKGLLRIKFDAYAFKISDKLEGNDIWDEFCFPLDIAQMTWFKVERERNIILINNGGNGAYPTIIASNPMRLVNGDVSVDIPAGESTSVIFRLAQGVNKIKVIGNGTIEFRWYKEVF